MCFVLCIGKRYFEKGPLMSADTGGPGVTAVKVFCSEGSLRLLDSLPHGRWRKEKEEEDDDHKCDQGTHRTKKERKKQSFPKSPQEHDK